MNSVIDGCDFQLSGFLIQVKIFTADTRTIVVLEYYCLLQKVISYIISRTSLKVKVVLSTFSILLCTLSLDTIFL